MAEYDPATHYDKVTQAWALLMGDDLHYGVFEDPDEPLADATGRLTSLMIEHARLEPGLRVLDVGCGPGVLTRELARRSGAGRAADGRQLVASELLPDEEGADICTTHDTRRRNR